MHTSIVAQKYASLSDVDPKAQFALIVLPIFFLTEEYAAVFFDDFARCGVTDVAGHKNA